VQTARLFGTASAAAAGRLFNFLLSRFSRFFNLLLGFRFGCIHSLASLFLDNGCGCVLGVSAARCLFYGLFSATCAGFGCRSGAAAGCMGTGQACSACTDQCRNTQAGKEFLQILAIHTVLPPCAWNGIGIVQPDDEIDHHKYILWNEGVASQGKIHAWRCSLGPPPAIGSHGVGEGTWYCFLCGKVKIMIGKVREIGITGKGLRQDGEDQGVGMVYSGPIELFTADVVDALRTVTQGVGILKGVDHVTALAPISAVAGDDNIAPAGQGVADGFMGFSAHDQGIPPGNGLEPFLLPRDVPGDPVVGADDPVGGHGSYKDDFHWMRLLQVLCFRSAGEHTIFCRRGNL